MTKLQIFWPLFPSLLYFATECDQLKVESLEMKGFSSMDEFDSFTGEICDFLRKDLVQREITKFFASKTIVRSQCDHIKQLLLYIFHYRHGDINNAGYVLIATGANQGMIFAKKKLYSHSTQNQMIINMARYQ